LIRYLAIFILGGLILIGCSEQRKREAAKLERELLANEGQNVDSAASDTGSLAAERADTSSDTVQAAPSHQAEQNDVQVNTAQGHEPSSILLAADTSLYRESERPADTSEPAPDVNAVPAENGSAQEAGTPSRVAGYVWTVQIASSTSQAYADSVIEAFTARGFEPYIAVATVDNHEVYRVRIGHFESSRDAAELKQKLAETYGLQPWIARLSF
jgi:cell division septation protein DedD